MRSFAVFAVALFAAGLTASGAAKVRIVQTNSAGDSVLLIDPATNKVVGEIKGIEANHGAAAAPDGSRLYVTNEAESTLDVVDARTLKVVTRIPLSGHPNNLSISKDGAWSMKFDRGVRPIAFEKRPDGSTARMFVQLSDLHGFAVVDFATHQETSRVTLPDGPAATKSLNVQGSPSHGDVS